MPSITQALPVSALSSEKDRQAIDNGDFSIWQRGDNIYISGNADIADRWKYITDDTNHIIHFRRLSTWSPSFDIPPEVGKDGLLLQSQGNEPNGTFRCLSQLIPDVRYGAEEVVTVSFWFYRASWLPETPMGDVTITQHFGGAELPVETVLEGVGVVTTGVWARASYSGVLPGYADKTITDNGFLELRIYFDLTNGTTFNDTGICSVQMNRGSRALPFVDRGRVEEERICKQYFERIHVAVGEWIAALHGRGSDPARGVLHYAHKWRNPTSITVSDVAHFNIVRNTAVITVGAFADSTMNRNRGNISVTGGDFDPQVDWLYWLSAVAAGAYIDVNAEPSV